MATIIQQLYETIKRHTGEIELVMYIIVFYLLRSIDSGAVEHAGIGYPTFARSSI